MKDSGASPVHIAVLSDKNVAACRSLKNLPIFRCDDKIKPGEEPDYTLLAFLSFLNAIPNKIPSGFVFSLLGGINSDDQFFSAMAFAYRIKADLVVWYSFAMTAPSEGAANPQIREEVEFVMSNNTTFIYPFLSLPILDSDRAIPVAGMTIKDSIFSLQPVPMGIAVNKPKVVSWGNWKDFERVWKRTNVAISVPDERYIQEGHGLAVWSITALIAMQLRAQKAGRGKNRSVNKFTQEFCVPVALQPENTPVIYGCFDPRIMIDVR